MLEAQDYLLEMLQRFESKGEFPRDAYIRYLSNQYHLTRPVIAHFFVCAAHPSMTKRTKFREFLIEFGKEEELHYSIAATDLAALDAEPEQPIEAVLEWQKVFWSACLDKPMFRLGATCVLENITVKADKVLVKLLSGSKYLTPKNTVFVQIHRHGENLPHGDQILEELGKLNLTDEEAEQLRAGSQKAVELSKKFMDYIESGNR